MGLTRLPTVMGVDLWLADLDDPSLADVDTLSTDERTRAARFVFDHDRRRYVAAHASLRQVLSARTDKPARRLEFEMNAYGKPRLRCGACSFNLSHSAQIAVIAVADTGSVGVDVEVTRPVADAALLADRLYTARERTEIEQTEDRDLAFLLCWTRKEACLKAVGWGLSIEPHTFEAGAAAAARTIGIPVASQTVHVAVESLFAGTMCVAAVARVLSSN